MDGNITETITVAKDYGYLPSDIGLTGKDYPYEDGLKYYSMNYNNYVYCPSPFNSDGSFNILYNDTILTRYNCLSNFNGIKNSQSLQEKSLFQSTWKEDSTIINNSNNDYHSPAACCCWRYHTVGTNQGDWYLPAMGELGYVMVRLKVINDILSLIKSKWNIGSIVSGSCWSSCEYNSRNTWYLNVNSGAVSNTAKGSNNTVRAFCRI